MNLMDKLKTFLGLKQEPPRNDFRNPIWGSDDDDDDDELYSRQQMHVYTDPLELHKEFAGQINDMLKSFGGLFGDMKVFLNQDSFESITGLDNHPNVSEPDHNVDSNSIREYYLKPGYHNRKNKHNIGDTDLDGKISSSEISGLLKSKEDKSTGTVAPFKGSLIPGRSFCQTIITTSVTKPDGTIETRRIIKNGNETIEETTTQSMNDSVGPINSNFDAMPMYSNILSELTSLFRNFY